MTGTQAGQNISSTLTLNTRPCSLMFKDMSHQGIEDASYHMDLE